MKADDFWDEIQKQWGTGGTLTEEEKEQIRQENHDLALEFEGTLLDGLDDGEPDDA